MSVTVPVIGLATMMALSLIARRWSYLTTSTSLMVMTVTLTAWLGMIFLMSG